MISTKDISVIVQGAISKTETPKTLKSIRKCLPDAEVILSTWVGSDVSALAGLYDVLIQNEDPGSVLIKPSKRNPVYNNMNRQLVSLHAGLSRVKRNYTLKLRSDLILDNCNFLEYFDKFQARSEKYKLFEKRIIVPSLFTKYFINSPTENADIMIPFHISDWWFFGLTKDIKKYIESTPLVEEPDFTNYFDKEENKFKKNPYNGAKFKFAPEQYFGYECFKRNFADIRMEDSADYNDELNLKSQICIANNFIVLQYAQSGIFMNKYKYSRNEIFAGKQYLYLYTFRRFEEEYKKHCDDSYCIAQKNLEPNCPELLRLYKHIFVLIDSDKHWLKRLEQLFIGVPISMLVLLKALVFSKFKKGIKCL